VPKVISVNVGMPRDHAWQGRTVYTGAWKEPVEGARMVRRSGVEGDGQGDLQGHGGPNRAVLVYQVESYAYWRNYFKRPDLGPGILAENLTVDELPDTEVCIGDRFRIGEAEFEVSQPRVTCFRAGMRIGHPEMASLLVAHHRPGFYLRVITEGRVAAGDGVVRTARGPGEVSVADIDALLYLPDPDRVKLRRAVDVPALSAGWRGSLQEMLDTAGKPRPPGHKAPAWVGFKSLKVAEVVAETPTVSSFHLADPDGAALAPARPGQYLTIRVPAAGATAVRSYSFSQSPTSSTYRISVLRVVHGQVSGYLHDHVHRGDQLEVAAPRGEFVLSTDTAGPAPIALISAGVGITPVLAMLDQLAAQESTVPVWWVHAARSPCELGFGLQVRQLLARLPAAQAFTFFSRSADREDRSAPGQVRHGRLDTASLAGLGLPSEASAYLCGPSGFMSTVTEGLIGCGLDAANIHTEAFGALDAINPGVVGEGGHHPHLPPGPTGTGPMITFARSGLSAPFDEAKKSLLEFAEACDVPTRWSCRTGVCRTCETGLVSGEVAYAPTPLEPVDTGRVLPCCSRPTTDAVIDM
jgi:ferredoxin-NADP reductase/MOSC domain-containing protein YiiM